MDSHGSGDEPVGIPGQSRARHQRRGLRFPNSEGDSADPFDVTVVIPTRNEAGNVNELLNRLDESLGALRAEILFVDDSDDETPSVIRDAAAQSRRPVRLLHREPGRRDGRLGGAVVAGFQLARAPWAVVIDGDLQHPPEAVPTLLREGLAPDVDLVYGTRYVDSGDATGLDGRVREWISTLSTFLAKIVFPRRLRGVSDPMSGFFAVRLKALNLPALRPAGYKVLLEILAESQLGRTAGVPYSFQPRFSGESKASLAEGMRFLLQLVALRLGLSVARLTQLAAFLAVGITGVGVNTLAMWCLSSAWLQLPYLLASVLATNIAIVWNFVLLETVVFRNARRRTFAAGFARFWLLNVALLPVQLGLLALLVEGAGLDPVAANVVTLVAVFFLRYVLTSTWVYSWKSAPADVLAGPARHRSPKTGIRPIRVVAPLAGAMVAFPAAAVVCWQLLRGGGAAGFGFVAVCLAAVVLIAMRVTPAPGDPDVHDRQLDFILATPLLAAAIWLSVGWPTRLGPAMPWGSREVIAFEVFLVGASLLLLGTRLTARIRWALCLPLLALPAITSRPLVASALIAAVIVATGLMMAARLRRRRSQTVAYDPDRTPRRAQRLPSWRLAGGVVAALAITVAMIGVVPSLSPSGTTGPRPASQQAP